MITNLALLVICAGLAYCALAPGTLTYLWRSLRSTASPRHSIDMDTVARRERRHV